MDLVDIVDHARLLVGGHELSRREPWNRFDRLASRGATIAELAVASASPALHRAGREQRTRVVRTSGDADGRPIEWPVPYWWVDAGAALMAILLAAVDEGLAAGFLGVHSVPDLADLLGMPEDQTPIGVVTIGHPLPDRRSGSLARGRRPRATVVHLERWGG